MEGAEEGVPPGMVIMVDDDTHHYGDDESGPEVALSAEEALEHADLCKKLMEKDCRVVKYSTKKGERAMRSLSVNHNRTEIVWKKTSSAGSRGTTSLKVAECTGIRFGVTTQVLRDRSLEQQKWDPAWRCFSLIADGRTFDFAVQQQGAVREAKEAVHKSPEDAVINCILGLQSVVRGANGYNRERLLSMIAIMKKEAGAGGKAAKVNTPAPKKAVAPTAAAAAAKQSKIVAAADAAATPVKGPYQPKKQLSDTETIKGMQKSINNYQDQVADLKAQLAAKDEQLQQATQEIERLKEALATGKLEQDESDV